MPSKPRQPTKPDLETQIIQAAMELASAHPWTTLSLGEIARAAEVSSAELYQHFSGRHAILKAAMRKIDLAMLDGTVDFTDPLKDRLFEVLMRRFDALRPYRSAIMNMAQRLRWAKPDAVLMGPPAARQLAASMRWALEAAGLTTFGPRGGVQARLLGLAFLSALRVWLDDDSEDLAKTMATLDRSLKRIEPFLNNGNALSAGDATTR